MCDVEQHRNFVWLRYYLILWFLIVFRISRFIISPTIFFLSLSVYTRICLNLFGVGGSSTNFSCSCSLQGSDCLQSRSWGRLFRQSSKSVIFKRWYPTFVSTVRFRYFILENCLPRAFFLFFFAVLFFPYFFLGQIFPGFWQLAWLAIIAKVKGKPSHMIGGWTHVLEYITPWVCIFLFSLSEAFLSSYSTSGV